MTPATLTLFRIVVLPKLVNKDPSESQTPDPVLLLMSVGWPVGLSIPTIELLFTWIPPAPLLLKESVVVSVMVIIATSEKSWALRPYPELPLPLQPKSVTLLWPKSKASPAGLAVQPNGSKLWRWKYCFQRKFRLMAFGSDPLISLADARAAHNCSVESIP